MFVPTSFARAFGAAACLLATGCSSGSGPSRPVSQLSLNVFTQNGGSAMAVGERVRASVTAMATEGCLFDSPCELSIAVELQSSRPDVIGLDQGKVVTPGDVWLTGKSVGTSMISAHVDGRTASRLMYVVEVPSAARR
jgi:hypothetical protein